jgi:hypothetical protein
MNTPEWAIEEISKLLRRALERGLRFDVETFTEDREDEPTNYEIRIRIHP